MDITREGAQRRALTCAIVALLLILVAAFYVASKEFGPSVATMISFPLLLTIPIAVRMRLRQAAVKRTEITMLAVLFFATIGGSASIWRESARNGWDRYHADDLRWAEFKRRLREEPAFRDIRVEKTLRKNIYWAEGEVDSESDLVRLLSLASECGISRQRLDGPYAHSVSLTVRRKSLE